MELIVHTWTLLFWIPLVTSVAAGVLAVGQGILSRPLPLVVWCLAALVLQLSSRPFSVGWTVGLAAQTALAIYVTIRVKLDA